MPEEMFDGGVAHGYDDHYGRPPGVVDEMVTALAPLFGGQDVAELGAGTGQVAGPLAAAGVNVIAIDPSEDMLAVLRRRYPSVPHLVTSGTTLPFDDGTLDGAMSFQVLHMVPEWLEIFKQMLRVVRPGGLLVVELPETLPEVSGEIMHRAWVELGRPVYTRALSTFYLLDEYAGSQGLELVELPRIGQPYTQTVEYLVWFWTSELMTRRWNVSAELMADVGTRLRAWADETYGLATEVPFTGIVNWRGYRLPA
ncbi:MAG TPA: methyltransferase domain-containing protein [Candidatus Saccharimonadia bacterium]|nr:methyltransferase domain-containing protein [Candidatus Saccharimonadia bacterium]